MVAALLDWISTLSLVFGGCCSNAVSLEQLTSQHPQVGTLLTFVHFLGISLYGSFQNVTWTRYGPRLKPRRIPLSPYVTQVALFYFISLLNNAAFAYRVPMSVHIIFRSGGLIVSMFLGWLISGKRYNTFQVLSVLIVTTGVLFTTLSASPSKVSDATKDHDTPAKSYIMGIAILAFALLLSGFLGLAQDWTWTKYGRPPHSGSHSPGSNRQSIQGATDKNQPSLAPAWAESMFYLHFLALPMFWFLRHDLVTQSARVTCRTQSNSIPPNTQLVIVRNPPDHKLLRLLPPTYSKASSIVIGESPSGSEFITTAVTIPAYLPLLVNTVTQLLCVAGVNRLTTRVSALTVTLVLVVRKAVSLVLSVFGLGRGRSDVDLGMMWFGATLVLVGTVGYAIGTGKQRTRSTAVDKSKKE